MADIAENSPRSKAAPMPPPNSDRAARALPPELLGTAIVGALAERMGIELTEACPERVVGTMPVEGNTQPVGLLHGGASAVLAETLGSIGAHLAAGEGRTAVGIELSITHHASARTGLVTATATAISLGRTLASYEIVVYGEETDRRLATARLTCLLRAAPSVG